MNKLKVAEYISMFFAIFGLILAVLLKEVPNYNAYFACTLLLTYNCICTFCLLISIYARYDITMKLDILRGKMTEFDNLVTTGRWKLFTLEIFVNFLAPYPYLDQLKYVED
jgi:hypothetical protein